VDAYTEPLGGVGEPAHELADVQARALRVGSGHGSIKVHMSVYVHLSIADDTHPHTPSEEQFALAAELLALLGDRMRLAVLHALMEGEADGTTLPDACAAAGPAVSQHLARLRLAGVVTTRKEGRRGIYSLRDGHLRHVVGEALNLADHRLAGQPAHD